MHIPKYKKFAQRKRVFAIPVFVSSFFYFAKIDINVHYNLNLTSMCISFHFYWFTKERRHKYIRSSADKMSYPDHFILSHVFD